MHTTKSKMKSFLKSAGNSTSSFFKSTLPNGGAADSRNATGNGVHFRKAATTTALFPTVTPDVDGEDCDHDCASCTTTYPAKFSIDESDKLYGEVKGWSTHIVVATGKSDWVRDVADEKGSVMEAAGRHGLGLRNGRCMLSASNMPVGCGDEEGEMVHGGAGGGSERTRVLLLPQWRMVEGVKPNEVARLMDEVVGTGTTNISALGHGEKGGQDEDASSQLNGEHERNDDGTNQPADDAEEGLSLQVSNSEVKHPSTTNGIPPSLPVPPTYSIKACPHRAIILMCSQKTRDARCGQSAPLLRKEFERILRPMGLYRDLQDERPGGVGVYFISHVGGHKYSANVMIYRRQGPETQSSAGDMTEGELNDEAVQGIWLARVRPEDCEGIVKFTVLQGKVVKPERQLRGGFDRERGLLSW